ncbi:MAG: RES family NAD+ phosphorylase [Gemmatimonadaceae bacterium]
MRLWRLTRQSFQLLDGEGARLFGGRWNPEGVPVVYTSGTLSLAALEYLVHVDIENAPADLVAVALDLPEASSIEDVRLADLPPDWRVLADHPACVAIGSRWAARAHSLALRVPSAVIPEESNVLLNPRHPEMQGVRVFLARPFTYDPRLLGG